MSWTPLRDRLHQLPLILAGPILRRTEPDSVTVWVALREARTVTLKVHATENGSGTHLGTVLLQGTDCTIALGQHLHVLAVTASPIHTQALEPDQIYAYDLSFEPYDRGFHAADDLPDPTQQTLQQALSSGTGASVSVSYFEHQLPTFALPPTDLNHLQIVHGSCRKPHGKGADALPIVDELIRQNASLANSRPHQLFFTGDQIYGDDVGDPLLWALMDAAVTLLGWEESLPIGGQAGGESVKAAELKPGQRSQIAEAQGGLTAGLPDQPQNAKSHLFSFGEYCALYLFSWSPVLWSESLPAALDYCTDPKQVKVWRQEAKELRTFAHTVWKVRRALANAPTYMIFDDHDISDDWYLNQAWCLRVLGRPFGRRVVQNGLLAYAVFQAWGNTPDRFQSGQTGRHLLKATVAWSAAAGKDMQAETAIARYLGLPPQDPLTGLPQMRRDGDVLVLEHDPQSLDWYYTVHSTCHEVIVMDTRTWRGYPADGSPMAPPMLLSPSAFEHQIRQPLQQIDRFKSDGKPISPITLVVAPTNLISLKAIDQIQQWQAKKRNVFKNDVGDAWNVHKGALAQLLMTLFEQRDRVIVLSGDIHYGSAVRLTCWLHETQNKQAAIKLSDGSMVFPSVLAQLTSSALENAEWKTQIIHTKLKSLLPERSRSWVGWMHPLIVQEIPAVQPSAHRRKRPIVTAKQLTKRFASQADQPLPEGLPDWWYHIDWMPRQPAQTPAWGKSVRWLASARSSPSPWWQRLLDGLTFWLWRNHWMQEGKEVVGLTNVGCVQFHWSEHADQCAVSQDLYWYAPWHPNTIVFSKFLVPLYKEIKFLP